MPPAQRRRVWITGLGCVSAFGVGFEPLWQALTEGRSAVGPIQAFDPAGFDCQHAAEVPEYKLSRILPKSYRKSAKVMARDIELAVIAAAEAAKHARLRTKASLETGDVPAGGDGEPDYPGPRLACHIGAGLIAAELDELTAALAHATDEQGRFDLAKWGQEGMRYLPPLWLLKYLPNMLACHVTILHNLQGPSNTITCAEASGALSLGEAVRVIRRNAADAGFCGGADSKLNPMGYLRQHYYGWLNTAADQPPTIRPFSQSAKGTLLGEAGALLVLEEAQAFQRRQQATPDAVAYAEVLGFSASQSVHPESRNLRPDPEGDGLARAAIAALRQAETTADEIDLVVPFGLGHPDFDHAEAQALQRVFGLRLREIPLCPIKPMTGNTGVASGALEVAVAAYALHTQQRPASVFVDDPLPELPTAAAIASVSMPLSRVLCLSSGVGGQNAAVVLGQALANR